MCGCLSMFKKLLGTFDSRRSYKCLIYFNNMQEELLLALKEHLSKRGYQALVPTPYVSQRYADSNFSSLDSNPEGTVTYIDGGNQSIYTTASFTLQFVRLFAVTYEGMDRVSEQKKEFYILVSKGSKCKVQWFDSSGPLEVNADSIESAVDMIRRYKELEFASEFENPVLDGNLYEDHELFIPLITPELSALSKTNQLVSDQGTSVVTDLLAMTDLKMWFYDLAKSTHTMYICKLHARANYCFKIETAKPELIYLLASHSRDPTFLGYPYGLVYADKMARVTDEEMRYVRIRILSSISESSITQHLNTQNAHMILDNL